MATTAVGFVVVNSLFVAATKNQCQDLSFYKVGFFYQSCFWHSSCWVNTTAVIWEAFILQLMPCKHKWYREKKYQELSRMVTNICLYSVGSCMHLAYSNFIAVLPNRILHSLKFAKCEICGSTVHQQKMRAHCVTASAYILWHLQS